MRRALLRPVLLGTGAGLLAWTPATVLAQAPDQAPVAVREPQVILPADGTDANPTTRPVTLTVPLRDGQRYLGDVLVEIDPDDTVRLSAPRLVELLAGILDDAALASLRARPASLADLAAAGVALRYDPQELALDLAIAGERRASRSLQVSPLDPELPGDAVLPAAFSAYVNL